ncbi:7-carboxy-7-deazaguanine synthase QueE [Streptomyces sp. NBC_01296]|uniref:7-carboxy-7-deazaguanine synthase QueE n=1 Tax=Streptomyces sp. NBC_01296 TaxID=2903816 RepID=UPI002E15CB82|nr:7-carboxy-7-deazaguanine synthase QueE [Streptomyces sp. NBC_01296]
MNAGALHLLSSSAADDRQLSVAETFGPTFQGEGPSTGRQALFIRLSRCNLSCGHGKQARWACDTPETWDFKRYDPRDPAVARRQSVESLTEWALSFRTPLVVITGGEPMIQMTGLTRLARALHRAGREIEIETNGTFIPSGELVESVRAFNVSPKLSSAGGRASARIVPAALRALAKSGKARFKFVISHADDLVETADLVERFALHEVWVMPEGVSSKAVLDGMREMADGALRLGFNLSPRLHTLLWEDERGR